MMMMMMMMMMIVMVVQVNDDDGNFVVDDDDKCDCGSGVGDNNFDGNDDAVGGVGNVGDDLVLMIMLMIACSGLGK